MTKMNTDKTFSAAQISKMFRVESSKQTLLNAEEKGIIPTAQRIQRGKTAYRAWSLEQLPLIGKAIGYLAPIERPTVLSVFSLKGGTGKSSLAFQVARTYALHGSKVLMIGLDAQESITQTLRKTTPREESANINHITEPNGIYHFLTDKEKAIELESLIQKTDLATLNYIAEGIELSVLDNWLNQQTRKEYTLKEKLVRPLLKRFSFDLIIFDCNPAWNSVVTSALAASDALISPLGADINSLKAARIFTDLLADFQDDMNHTFDTFFIVPTMLEANKLSQSVQARYRLDYDTLCTITSIRRAVAVQESNLNGTSLMEYAPDSPAYDDFVGVMKEISAAINVAQMAKVSKVNKKKSKPSAAAAEL